LDAKATTAIGTLHQARTENPARTETTTTSDNDARNERPRTRRIGIRARVWNTPPTDCTDTEGRSWTTAV